MVSYDEGLSKGILQKPSLASSFVNTVVLLNFMGNFLQGWGFIMLMDDSLVQVMGI